MTSAVEGEDGDRQSRRMAVATVTGGALLAGCGVAGTIAWQRGLWGTLTVAALLAAWLLLLGWWTQAWPRRAAARRPSMHDAPPAAALRSLLDQMPIPLLLAERDHVRALNRAARMLFATDDRLLPSPPELTERSASHLRHEGRDWRIDAVDDLDGPRRRLIALVDVQAEQRTAEARATAEMIQVLGHELLNGLSPIASLAESGMATLSDATQRDRLLPEILATLVRRVDGLQRFTLAYRRLARLPDPVRTAVDVRLLVDDLERLFDGRWGGDVALATDIGDGGPVDADRDQLTQALWALLQNAAEAAVTGTGAAGVRLAVERGAAELRFVVEDSGPGVAAADARRIFRPFHTTKPAGTGVGLSLARQIGWAHGGDLSLEGRNRFVLAVPR